METVSEDRHGLPDMERLSDWLSTLGIDSTGRLEVRRVGAGLSNLTYRVDDAVGRSWVLRRPPSGHLLESAHDVLREARIIKALEPTPVPVPRILAVHEDSGSVPWVLMEHLDGTVVDTMELAHSLDVQTKRSIAFDMARTLAAIHRVDLEQRGLADLASTNPYAGRQLRRWTRQWEASRTGDLPELDALTDRLGNAAPEREHLALVHGDFHIKNVISRDGALVGVFDWELSTLGDPIADLGTLLAYWPHPGEMPLFDAAAPSTVGGFPTRDELVAVYADVAQLDCSSVGFWHVLGLWKIAIIAEGVARRATENPADRPAAGVPTRHEVEQLVAYAHDIAGDAGL